MIVPVQSHEVDRWWPHVRDFIAQVPQTALAEEDVLEELRTGRNQLWVAVDGSVKSALVTELQQYPQERICVLILMAGALSDAKQYVGTIERWAKEAGCNAVEIYGRPGWEKVLDYKRKSVLLRKEL